jgi:hypothetical protein
MPALQGLVSSISLVSRPYGVAIECCTFGATLNASGSVPITKVLMKISAE